jgi:hypothetical protein
MAGNMNAKSLREQFIECSPMVTKPLILVVELSRLTDLFPPASFSSSHNAVLRPIYRAHGSSANQDLSRRLSGGESHEPELQNEIPDNVRLRGN